MGILHRNCYRYSEIWFRSAGNMFYLMKVCNREFSKLYRCTANVLHAIFIYTKKGQSVQQYLILNWKSKLACTSIDVDGIKSERKNKKKREKPTSEGGIVCNIIELICSRYVIEYFALNAIPLSLYPPSLPQPSSVQKSNKSSVKKTK